MQNNITTTTDIIAALNTVKTTGVVQNTLYDYIINREGFRVSKTLTCNGNGAQNDNIFVITGGVTVTNLCAECMRVGAGGAATFGTCYWDLWDGTAAIEITDNGGTNLSGIGVGALISKDAVATSPLNFDSNAAGNFVDGGGGGFYKLACPFRVLKKLGANTYIRFNFTGDANTDVDLKFTVSYVPRTDDGAITAA